MSSDFGYINARVRGMRSRLLGPETFGAALAAEDFRAFTTVLGQTPYGPSLEEAQATSSGIDAVDRALAHDFHETTRSLLGFSDGTPREMIAALLRRYDLEDLKTIARAKHAGRTPESLDEALSGAGDLRPSTLQALAAAPDLPAAAQALAVTKHPLARAFTRAARGYASDGDLFEFEVALDRAHFASLLRTADRPGVPDTFVRHVAREIEAANLRTALKLGGRDGDLGVFWLPGGRGLGREEFVQLATQGFAGLGSLGAGTFPDLGAAEDLADAERRIRGALDAAARREALRDPLGIGVVLRFLRQKETETAKLRLLARGAYYRVPRESLEKELTDA